MLSSPAPSQRRRRHIVTPEPQVAVVVATRNRAELVDRLVTALDGQVGAPPFEVVLVDDASTDDTWDVISAVRSRAAAPVRTIRLPQQSGPAAARNVGWRSTAAGVIAFTDDDCVPVRGWLSELVTGLDGADIAQGATVPAPDQRHLLGPFARTMEVTSETGYYQTCNVAYRRATLEAVGGFDDDLRQAGEDVELATRAIAAGARTTFRVDAVVHHDVRPSSLRAQLDGTPRWAGIVLAVRKRPELRHKLHHGLWWKRSHPAAVAAAAGVAAAVTGGPVVRLVGAAATAPYIRRRILVEPLPHTRRADRVRLLPAALVADLAEVAVLAVASVRYRTPVL